MAMQTKLAKDGATYAYTYSYVCTYIDTIVNIASYA